MVGLFEELFERGELGGNLRPLGPENDLGVYAQS